MNLENFIALKMFNMKEVAPYYGLKFQSFDGGYYGNWDLNNLDTWFDDQVGLIKFLPTLAITYTNEYVVSFKDYQATSSSLTTALTTLLTKLQGDNYEF